MSFEVLQIEEKQPVISNGYTEIIDGILQLTNEGKIALTDLYIQGKSITEARHQLFLERSMVVNSYQKKKAIEQHAKNLMNGNVKNILPDETIETIPPPESISELKSTAKLAFPECNVEPFEYVIDKIIQYSKSDGTGDWEFYRNNIGE